MRPFYKLPTTKEFLKSGWMRYKYWYDPDPEPPSWPVHQVHILIYRARFLSLIVRTKIDWFLFKQMESHKWILKIALKTWLKNLNLK